MKAKLWECILNEFKKELVKSEKAYSRCKKKLADKVERLNETGADTEKLLNLTFVFDELHLLSKEVEFIKKHIGYIESKLIPCQR